MEETGLLCAGRAPGSGRSCCVQEAGRLDCGTNTEPDWEDQIRTTIESGCGLSRDFNAIKLEQQEVELDFHKRKSELRKRKDEAIKEHQSLLKKLDSVRVKLQLNNSKATRKNFLSKVQEITSERNHAQEERDRFAAELVEAESRLSALEAEQGAEQSLWEQEVSELRRQTERAHNEAREAACRAQRDERVAVERERDTANERIETWLNQVGVYLNSLKAEFPQRYQQEKSHWETREMAVKQRQSQVQSCFIEILLQLQRDQSLESLSLPTLPHLPQVPMAALYFHRIMQMNPLLQAPPPHATAPPPLRPVRGPLLPTLPTRHALPFVRPPPLSGQHFPPPPLHHYPPPRFAMTSPAVHGPPPRAQTPPLSKAAAPPSAAPLTVPVAPPALSTSAPHSAPPAAGTLTKILKRLTVQFPQISMSDLTKLLQQVKTDRGHLTGLSLGEVVELVRQKVEESGAVGAVGAVGPTGPAVPAVSGPVSRKPCLMCQKPVEPEARFELSCVHTMHKECIRMWVKSSKSHSCPFCPK